MEKKVISAVLTSLLLVSVFMISVSAATTPTGRANQIRPMNTMNHPGLTNPFVPRAEGPNHTGPSDYMNKWLGISELCEQGDMQLRPANQGLNIIKFFVCGGGD